MDALDLRLKELDDNHARLNRDADELIALAEEALSRCRKVHADVRHINANYNYMSKMGCCNQETVYDAEPLAQTTEDDANNTAR
jgi:hypothetical protein